jgi:hypothetical protein
MRDYLCALKLMWRQVNGLASDRLSIAEDVGGHRSGRDVSIGVMYVTDVRNVRDVGYVSNVGDVHLTDVVFPAVIPREVWLARSERKPGGKTGHAHTDGH